MTSEILILTPSAVALAADSAVTVGNKKTYNGVNKLFMLSNDPPMGIMTYNLSHFSNVPLETIIKEFRLEIKDDKLNTVEEFKDKFREYLEKLIKDSLHSYSIEEQLDDFIKQIKIESQHMEYSIFESIVKNVVSNVSFDVLNDFSEEISNTLRINENKFNELIPNEIKGNQRKDFLQDLKKFFVYNLYIEPFTGIVIAGFNKDRLFPSYIEFNVTYLFEDNFILKEKNHLDIIGNLVHVRPLAQDDVINTFLTSIDKDTEFKLTKYVYKFYEDYTNNLKEAINSNSHLDSNEKTKFLNEISKIESENKNLGKLFEEFINQVKDDHTNHLLDSISALPKEELSNLAESLINITSLKRKIGSDLETVGGPVDVAIITKGDGFIWTKRKHYFDASLNPQFFDRKDKT